MLLTGSTNKGVADILLEKLKQGYEERQLYILKRLANAGPGRYDSSFAQCAIAKLYLSRLTGEDHGVAEANNILMKITTRFPRAGEDGYYWALTFDVRAYYLFKEDPHLLYRTTKEAIMKRLWNYVKGRSNRSIPIDSWHFWGTENHMMWRASTFLLASQIFSDRIYDDGATGSTHYQHWRAWFSQWMDERAKKGWLEISSPTYQDRSMTGIVNIYNFCQDATLRKKAEMTLDWLFADYAQEQIKGVRGGAKVRVYRGSRSKSGDGDGMYRNSYLLFGEGGLKGRDNLGLVHLATSEYHVPEVVIDLAVDRVGRGSYTVKARRPSAQWGEFKARKYSYVTPDYILGAFQDNDRYSAYWNDRWVGLIFATSPDARIYLWGRRGGDKAPGQQRLGHEKYFQHENVLIAQVGKAGTDYPTMAYFPNSLDKIHEEDGWVFVKEGSAYAAYRPVSGGYHWSGRYIVCETKGVSAILEAARASDYSSFSDFKEDVKNRRFNYSNGIVEYENRNGDIIRVDFDNPKVNGQPVDLASYKTFDSPYIQSEWDSGYIKVSKGKRYLILDFTSPDNPTKIEGSIES